MNSIKQKPNPISKTIETYLKMALRMIKVDSREETSLPAGVNFPSFATRLRNGGKIQRSLLLPALANAYKTLRDGRLIASSKNSLQKHASPTEGYPNTIGYPFSQLFAKCTHLAYILAETECKREIQASLYHYSCHPSTRE